MNRMCDAIISRNQRHEKFDLIFHLFKILLYCKLKLTDRTLMYEMEQSQQEAKA